MVLKIDDKIDSILKKQAIDLYLDKLVKHCHSHYPYLKEKIDYHQLKKILSSCLTITKEIGFNQEDTTRFYIDLIILFGIEFIHDPQYRWAKKILDDYQDFTEVTQAEELYFKAIPFLEGAYGKDLCKKDEIFKKLDNYLKSQSTNYVFSKEKSLLDKSDIKQQVITALNEIVQSKFQITESEDFDHLFSFGIDRAQNHLLMNHPTEIATAIILMFIFGSHFDQDPFLSGELIDNTQLAPQTIYDESINFNSIYHRFCHQFPWLPSLIEMNINKQELI